MTTTNTAPGSVSEQDANIALRLGWMMAECLGRLRPDGPPYGSQSQHADISSLPLDAADERSMIEMQIESTKVLASVAVTAKVDVGIDTLTGQDPNDYPGLRTATAGNALKYRVSRLLYARNHVNDLHATLKVPALTDAEEQALPSIDALWQMTAELIWVWDAAIQDQLASGDFGRSSAYQLGRGLAESYWLLDLNAAAGTSRSWLHLLGNNRVAALGLLCRRLSASIGTVTSPAIEASIQAWAPVAQHPDQYLDPRAKLGEQLLVWRDLLLTQRDPTSLVPANILAKESRRLLPLANAFKGELALGAVAAGALGASAFYLPHLGGSIGALLSAFGLTATAVGGKAKSTIQSVGDRVRTGLAQEAVNTAVIIVPQRTTEPVFLGLGSRDVAGQKLAAAYRP